MNLLEELNIKIEHSTSQKTIISLKVSDVIKQPYGFVHGGINAVLAETAASIAANCVAPDGQIAIGASVNTNHLTPVSYGVLKAIAHPIHIGGSLQVWQVEIFQFPLHKLSSTSVVTTVFHAAPK
ncbi:ComA operon protein 2 [Liquorilactobacillus sucicola DSM 21376 = JCM 15457]|uniref:Thioesterase domain-containing protein n=1 Tax=Liquorilactobacillus sucicola DSM 21376 = JCM 15457 TaxID=1423806 RepID=A0A023CZL2_9LACO|nr:PaaI family thioesterase [Liquorilactobacillus sucicola]KRN06758.1 hypothetical protein FD15_GL000313 [Liquorilactobacillus sucicola DSM 21376 = JCM 15457]GAJ27031.1 ComA operon protein 2 [Liquorilactobacillus sucicola DSM 21376 = JCM 15457]